MGRFPFGADLDYAGAMVRERDDHLEDEARFKAKLTHNYKRLPPYGRRLMAMREAGKVPPRTVMVTFEWNLAKAHPRIIILADANPAELEFQYLAGFPVHIIYRSKDAHRVDVLAQEIMLANPCFLATWALDLVGIDDALTIIKPYQCAE